MPIAKINVFIECQSPVPEYILLIVIEKVRSIAAFTVLLFTVELLALPCGTACHRTHAEGNTSSEHSCHEAPVQEDLVQIAAVPSACTHQHDLPDPAPACASGDRDQHVAIPAIVLLASHVGLVPLQSVLSPPDRASIRIPSLTISLRI